MTRRKAVRVEHLSDIPTDLPGVFWRVERRWWADGSSCLHVAKWGTQPETGRPAPWWPQQYLQTPWELAESLVAGLQEAMHRGNVWTALGQDRPGDRETGEAIASGPLHPLGDPSGPDTRGA